MALFFASSNKAKHAYKKHVNAVIGGVASGGFRMSTKIPSKILSRQARQSKVSKIESKINRIMNRC